jgi:fermentation-respiration switch protein FrsA (DUF1100 family)
MPSRRLVRRAAASLLLLGATGYAAVLAGFRVAEPRLLYHPLTAGRPLAPPPPELALPYERVRFTSGDGVPLVGWAVPAAAPDSSGVWVLICHGNTGDVSYGGRPRYYDHLRRIGVNVLAFDYRGFGESGGAISEAGLYRDADAAYRYLRTARGVPPERIVIFGHSLGSAVAIELATRVPAAGLVVEGALTSVPDRAGELYPFLPVSLVAASRFASRERIAAVRMPKLLLHATADDVIPLAHGRRLFALAAEPKRLVELDGGHDDAYTVDRARYFAAFAAFVREVTGG